MEIYTEAPLDSKLDALNNTSIYLQHILFPFSNYIYAAVVGVRVGGERGERRELLPVSGGRLFIISSVRRVSLPPPPL